jgi:4-hydroxyphenylpyruvate dioxygenase-like putative hemolysin
VVMQCTHFNEVKDALLDAIDEINKTSFHLKKASEEYYFPDKDQVSWGISHDVCVDMQKMAILLDKSAHRFQQVFDTQTPLDLSLNNLPTMNSDYPSVL